MDALPQHWIETTLARLRDEPAEVRQVIIVGRVMPTGVCLTKVHEEAPEDGHPVGTRLVTFVNTPSSTSYAVVSGTTAALPATEVGAYVSDGIVDQLRLAAKARWIPPTVRS